MIEKVQYIILYLNDESFRSFSTLLSLRTTVGGQTFIITIQETIIIIISNHTVHTIHTCTDYSTVAIEACMDTYRGGKPCIIMYTYHFLWNHRTHIAILSGWSEIFGWSNHGPE